MGFIPEQWWKYPLLLSTYFLFLTTSKEEFSSFIDGINKVYLSLKVIIPFPNAVERYLKFCFGESLELMMTLVG